MLPRSPPKSLVPMKREVSEGRLVSQVCEGVGRAVGALWGFGDGEVVLVVWAMSQRAQESISQSSSSFSAPEAQRETVFVCASCNQTLSK